jgi:hypothetical protein
VICIFYASTNNWDTLAGALFLLFVPTSCILGLGILITWLNLRGFLCPRCGKRFTLTWWNNWPTNRCKHCELNLGPAMMATAKSPANVDLWE